MNCILPYARRHSGCEVVAPRIDQGYNAARNDPYLEHHHPFYTPLEKVSDSAIKEAGLKYGSGSEESFLKTFVNPPELKKTLKI